MRKILIIVLLLMGLFSSAIAQEEVIFTIQKTDGSTINFVIDSEARIYYSDTQLLFYDGNEMIPVNLSKISKACFTVASEVEETVNQQFGIHPNPVKYVLRISNVADNSEVSIYSINGTVLKKLNVSGDTDINISDLHSGLYIIGIGNEFSKFIKM